MTKKRTTLYLTEEARKWLKEEAKQENVSRSYIVQLLIKKAKDESQQSKTKAM